MAGIVFPKGAHSGAIGTSSPGLYVTTKRAWNDGSVKHAIVSGVAQGGSTITFNGVPNSGTPLTHSDIVAANPTASLDVGVIGSASLTPLLAAPPTRTWISTPGMAECHYRTALAAANTFAEFRVRLFSNGAIFVRILVENSHRLRAQEIDLTLSGAVLIGGETVYSYAETPIYRNTLHIHERWIGGTQHNHLIKNDMAQVVGTKLVPHYGMTDSIAESALAALPTEYVIGSQLSFSKAMGMGGFQPQLGLIPNWEAMAIISNDDRAVRSVYANGKAAFNFAINWREGARMLIPSDYPKASAEGQGGGGTDTFYSGTLAWEIAHHPSMGYFAYLISGDYLYLEALLGQCATLFQASPTVRGDGVNRLFLSQTRSTAWCQRSVGQAAAIVPDDYDAKADYPALLASQISYFNSISTGDPLAKDSKLGYPSVSSTYNDKKPQSIASWMHHFWIASVGFVQDMEPMDAAQMDNLKTLCGFMYQGITGILGKSGDFDFTRGETPTITVSNEIVPSFTFRTAAQIFKSWGEVWEANFPGDAIGCNILQGYMSSAPSSAASGYWGNLLPAIAYAVDHQAEGAEDCWARLTGANNWLVLASSDFSKIPVWGITPRLFSIRPTSHYACPSGGRVIAGRYSLPAWRRNMAPRTWTQVGSNTIADLDPAKNPAMNPNYPSNPEWRGIGGQSAVVYAWCGACFDFDKGQLWLPLSGGHGDYAGNEAYYLDLYSDAPQWRMPRPPSGAIGNILITKDGQEETGVYADGQPRAIHSYNKHLYVPGLGVICAFQGGCAYSAAGTRDTWLLNGDSGMWTKLATALYVPSSSGSAACYDPGRHCIWWLPQSDGYLQQLNLATMQWTMRMDYPRINSSNYKRLLFLADKDLIILFDKGQPSGFGIFDMAAKTLSTPSITGTMPAGLAGGDIGQSGSDWHPDGFVALWHHTTDMARIATLTPGANMKTDPWTWGEIVPAAESLITPSARLSNGTYGRFGYSAVLNGYFLQNDVSRKTYFFAAD